MPSEAKPSSKQGRRLGPASALAAAGLVVLLGFGELWARHEAARDGASLPAMLGGPSEAGTTEDGRPIFTGMRDLTRPHLDGVFRGADYRSDAISFRGADRPRGAAPGTRRIIVTGDSIALGAGVEEAEAFPMAAEAWLEREAAPPAWEVFNAGMAGANAAFAMQRLERGLRRYGADVIVYGFSPNDLEGPAYQRFPAERTAFDLIAEAGWPARSKSELIRMAAWRWYGLWDRIIALNVEHHAREVRFNAFENPAAWENLLNELDRFAGLGEPEGRCAVLLVLTRLVALKPEEHPFGEVYDAVIVEARSRGLHVVDTRSLFLGREADELRHSVFDPHPNVAAHAEIGALLGEAVAGLPEACWTASDDGSTRGFRTLDSPEGQAERHERDTGE